MLQAQFVTIDACWSLIQFLRSMNILLLQINEFAALFDGFCLKIL